MLKDEIIHFILSLAAGMTISVMCDNYWAFPAAIAGGFLIDSDHLFDYLSFKKFKVFSLGEFMSCRYFECSGKVYLPLHGFEYAISFMFLGLYTRYDWFFFALGLSLLLHLMFDVLHNRPHLPTYFLSYRLYHSFDHKEFGFKGNSRSVRKEGIPCREVGV